MIKNLFIYFRLILRLGAVNIIRILFYKIKLKSGILALLTPPFKIKDQKIFDDKNINQVYLNNEYKSQYLRSAEKLLSGNHSFFFYDHRYVGSPPKWRYWSESCENIHWTKVRINEVEDQDIKFSWDLSRFHWMPTFAAAYCVSKDSKYLSAINHWCSDWIIRNEPNTGLNWVCAQEVSIRLINIINTSYLLGINSLNASDNLIDLIFAHCQRIIPTIDYAISQDNNHGITEASALYIAGNWLKKFPQSDRNNKMATKSSNLGRRLLEQLISKLVLPDGGFSMGALAYHRVVLDTLSIVEFWRDELRLPKLPSLYYQKACSMVHFLYQLHDSVSGDVSNIGANDGSRSFLLTSSDYRDFRPSLQLASGYFCKSTSFKYKKINWYSADLPKNIEHNWNQKTSLFKDSGFIKLIPKTNCSSAIIKFPVHHFRPSQSDALHFDLWWRGRNILTDSGSYSYNCSEELESYFSGSAGHNSVQFDNRSQCPRLEGFFGASGLKQRQSLQLIHGILTNTGDVVLQTT